MKFQIILEATEKRKAQMADDEFEKLMRRVKFPPGFSLIGGRSLEGIQAEIWQPASREKDPLE